MRNHTTLRQAVLAELARRKEQGKQPATVSGLARAMHNEGHMAASTVHYWLRGQGRISDDKVDAIFKNLGLQVKR